jgi:hypothetical protein
MSVDLKKLDDRIKKLQQLRELAADPEMAGLLAEFAQSSPHSVSAPPNGNGASLDGLFECAKKAIATFSGDFTVKEFAEQLKAAGYKFQAKDEDIATYGVLRRLKDKGAVRISVEGGPGKAARWISTKL